MEYEDNERAKDGISNKKQTFERNPAILLALDAVHRSLLHNNLKYEGRNLLETDDDDLEYFSSKSSIASDDNSSSVEDDLHSNCEIEDVTKEHRKVHISDKKNIDAIISNKARWPEEKANRKILDGEHKQYEAKQQNKLKYVNRFNMGSTTSAQTLTDAIEYNNNNNSDELQLKKTNSMPRRQQQEEEQQQYLTNVATLEQKNKCSRRIKTENETNKKRFVCEYENASKEKQHKLQLHRSQQQQQPHLQRHALCSKDSSDTDVTSSEHRDSDTNNLLIENQKNRACEMYQKISYNNGYYTTSGSSSNSYCTSDTNSAISSIDVANTHLCHIKKCCSQCFCANGKSDLNNLSNKKRRSLPINHIYKSNQVSNATDSNGNVLKSKAKQIKRKSNQEIDANVNEVKTRDCEKTRKITISIKTKAASESNTQLKEKLNQHYFNDYETDETDTTESDYVTVVNDSDPKKTAVNAIEYNAFHDTTKQAAPNQSEYVILSDIDNTNSYLSINSDTPALSEQSQYFDCVTDSDRNTNEFVKRSSMTSMNSNVKQHDKIQPKSCIKQTNSTKSAMICIVQEMSRDRTVTSTVEIDRKKIREFKKNQKKHRPKIIDDTFCEEILNETLNMAQKSNEKKYGKNIDKNAAKPNTDECKHVGKNLNSKKNTKNVQSFVSDGFVMSKLNASPKYTGKSIGRLLAHRLEQNTLTNMRRTILEKTAFDILISDKEKQRKKKLMELPPIKPPRSFIASASSSPLSKQSVESSATIPIEDLHRPSSIGFVTPSSASNYNNHRNRPQFSETSTHIGWIQPERSVKNESAPPSNSLHFYTANDSKANEIGWSHLKEDIDTVDCPNLTAQEFEKFSANLDENRYIHLSTPIKDKPDSILNNSQFVTANQFDSSMSRILENGGVDRNGRCLKCHGTKIKKSPNLLSSKTGKRIGKAALKRTKTFIDSSKQWMKKPSSKSKEVKTCNHCNHNDAEVFSTPLKSADNTARFNSDSYCSHQYQKDMKKVLNLTPNINANAGQVALNPSPERNTNRVAEHLLRAIPEKPIRKSVSSQVNETTTVSYATPQTSFNFNRIVDSPAVNKKVEPNKASPSKFVTKLNQLAKGSKALFRNKTNGNSPKQLNPADMKHYYKSYNGNDVDNRVPLMGELLQNLRDKMENDKQIATDPSSKQESEQRLPSARKSLFRARTLSTSSGDLLDEESICGKIAEIDLHDEPEPLYAEIKQPPISTDSFDKFESCLETPTAPVDTADGRKSVELKEVFITDSNGQRSNKYIMVNNNPKALYATINRYLEASSPSPSIEINSHATEPAINNLIVNNNSILTTASSCESLDLSSIGEFAKSLQNMIDEHQSKMHRIYNNEDDTQSTQYTDAPNESENLQQKSVSVKFQTCSPESSDLSSGCSSFYRKNTEIMNSGETKLWHDLMDSLSFDTVQTGSYCESVTRGNDMNGEIKQMIGKLEEEEIGSQFNQSDDFSYDFKDRDGESYFVHNVILEESTNSGDLSQQSASGDQTEYHTINSQRNSSNDTSPNNSKRSSPNYKLLKNKLRNSLRKSKKYLTNGKWSDRFESNRNGMDENKCETVNPNQVWPAISNYPKMYDEKLYNSIHSQIASIPMTSRLSPSEIQLVKLEEKINHQHNIRQELRCALQICRSTKEFQNSAELVESERLMVLSNLKECVAKEELIRLCSQNAMELMRDTSRGTINIAYLEFSLKDDALYDTHFNYFYFCVCSYHDQIECTSVIERKGNRVIFSNFNIQFIDVMSDFEIRIEVFVLRLRKNLPHNNHETKNYKKLESDAELSRFRFQGRTIMISKCLSNKGFDRITQHNTPRNLRKTSTGDYIYTMYDIKSQDMTLYGDINNLNRAITLGFQNEITFDSSNVNGFLNIAHTKWKWDRLWGRLDGFFMHFWTYPQDASYLPPVLTLNMENCLHKQKIELVDREICAKPRTFQIDICNNLNNSPKTGNPIQVQSYFIAAETQLDLEQWLCQINRILKMIENWNI